MAKPVYLLLILALIAAVAVKPSVDGPQPLRPEPRVTISISFR